MRERGDGRSCGGGSNTFTYFCIRGGRREQKEKAWAKEKTKNRRGQTAGGEINVAEGGEINSVATKKMRMKERRKGKERKEPRKMLRKQEKKKQII